MEFCQKTIFQIKKFPGSDERLRGLAPRVSDLPNHADICGPVPHVFHVDTGVPLILEPLGGKIHIMRYEPAAGISPLPPAGNRCRTPRRSRLTGATGRNRCRTNQGARLSARLSAHSRLSPLPPVANRFRDPTNQAVEQVQDKSQEQPRQDVEQQRAERRQYPTHGPQSVAEASEKSQGQRLDSVSQTLKESRPTILRTPTSVASAGNRWTLRTRQARKRVPRHPHKAIHAIRLVDLVAVLVDEDDLAGRDLFPKPAAPLDLAMPVETPPIVAELRDLEAELHLTLDGHGSLLVLRILDEVDPLGIRSRTVPMLVLRLLRSRRLLRRRRNGRRNPHDHQHRHQRTHDLHGRISLIEREREGLIVDE